MSIVKVDVLKPQTFTVAINYVLVLTKVPGTPTGISVVTPYYYW